MSSSPDTSDLRALARVILDQEEIEQSAMRPAGRAYEVAPVRRRLTEGVRIGLLLGFALGIASTGAGTTMTLREPAWFASFVFFTASGAGAGAIVGAGAGLVVRFLQRRRLDSELRTLVERDHR